MSKIFELAAELGSTLKEDERLQRLAAAKRAYETDATLQALITEYEVQQAAIEQAAGASEIDTHLIDVLQERIDRLFRDITEHAAYRELEAAQKEVNSLMNAVNSTISYHITGELPGDCTHNCASCGGCH